MRLLLLSLLFFVAVPCTAAEIQDLARMSIEELMALTVTSVSKKDQVLSDSAAAVFVITAEDIERSGVTNIPDALRMAPGVNVARIDANKWAVSCRGFNGRFSAKLLVLIDGRSVYAPTFSGVYWETNDVLLADVDRIEVIRGPGASLWGANAVNGVINIITKHTAETQGGLVEAGAGDMEQGFAAVRYGGSIGTKTHWRVYAKGSNRDDFQYSSGADAGDNWEMRQTGFRLDAASSKKDSITLQGDLYKGDIDQDLLLVTDTAPFMQTFPTETDVSGGNILSVWQRQISAGSDLRFQAYFDHTERSQDVINEDRDNLDLDFQHRFIPAQNHDVIWGLRYRYSADDYINSSISDFNPLSDRQHLFSAFVQDEISLFSEAVRLTLGSKFEHNDFTGFEIQPTARIMWAPQAMHRIWASVSHAVRTPSRAETDADFSYAAYDTSAYGFPNLSYVVRVKGNEHFESEELNAYELGYRFLPKQTLSLDLALFYNDYDNLRAFDVRPPYLTGATVLGEYVFVNTLEGKTYGLELAAGWQPHDLLKCHLAYTFTDRDIKGSTIGGTPRHQVSARGQLDLTDALALDIWLRYVDESHVPTLTGETGTSEVDDYLTLDIRLGWDIRPDTTLSLVASNLLAGSHTELIQEAFSHPVEVDRSFYAKISCRF